MKHTKNQKPTHFKGREGALEFLFVAQGSKELLVCSLDIGLWVIHRVSGVEGNKQEYNYICITRLDKHFVLISDLPWTLAIVGKALLARSVRR